MAETDDPVTPWQDKISGYILAGSIKYITNDEL